LSAATVVIAVVAALLVPTYSETSPQPVNIYLVTDGDSGEAHWVSLPAEDNTPALLREKFEAEPAAVFPWLKSAYLIGRADPTGAAAPALDVLSDERGNGKRTVTVQLRSPR